MDDKNKYGKQLQNKIDNLRDKLRKIESAKEFDKTPAGALLIEHIQEEVNRIFKEMTDGDPLDREAYLVNHAAISVYRGMLKAIANKATDEAKVKKELEDVTTKQRLQQSNGQHPAS